MPGNWRMHSWFLDPQGSKDPMRLFLSIKGRRWGERGKGGRALWAEEVGEGVPVGVLVAVGEPLVEGVQVAEAVAAAVRDEVAECEGGGRGGPGGQSKGGGEVGVMRLAAGRQIRQLLPLGALSPCL